MAVAAKELRRQHARIAELEAELEAVGAGGVQRFASAPQAVQPVLGWIHKLRNGKIGSKFYTYEPHCDCAVRDDGGEKIPVVAAPAHPAEGVPAQAPQNLLAELERIAEKYAWAFQDAGTETYAEQVQAKTRKAKQALTAELKSALATHPTQQGLEATVIENAERFQFIVDNNLILSGGTKKFGWPIAPFGKECVRYIDKERAALAAQAKQGEQANG